MMEKSSINESMPEFVKKYLEVKKDFPNTLIFLRMGDFYETLFNDAKIVSKILDLRMADKLPMCGVPHQSASGYLKKIIEAGHRVALCEVTAEPGEAADYHRGAREVVLVKL